jgi:hypothetical protein
LRGDGETRSAEVLLSRVLTGVEDAGVDAVAAVEEATDEARADEAAGAGHHHRLAARRPACHLRRPSLLSSPSSLSAEMSQSELRCVSVWVTPGGWIFSGRGWYQLRVRRNGHGPPKFYFIIIFLPKKFFPPVIV